MTQLPTFGSPVIHQYNASYLPKAQAGPEKYTHAFVGGEGGVSGSFVNQYHSGTSLPPKGQNNCKIWVKKAVNCWNIRRGILCGS
jgi:hypothetical protein